MNLKVADAKREEGFTLIELLVVVIIIGILAAIAIPVFLNQRERAWIRTAESDVRNAAIEVESYFNDDFEYPADTGTGAGTFADLLANDIELSPNIVMTYDLDATGQFYTILACHELVFAADCPSNVTTTEATAVYISNQGGIQQGYPAS